MQDNVSTNEPKKVWVAPVLVEYGDITSLTQTKTFFKTNGGGDDLFQISSDI